MSRLNVKQNTNDLSVCNIFWRLWCSNDLIHSYRCPNLNPVLGLVLGKWAWVVNLDISNNIWWFFNDLFIYFCCYCVVYVVSLQGTWSEFHKGCNSVGLLDKTHDNISSKLQLGKKHRLLRKIRKTKIVCKKEVCKERFEFVCRIGLCFNPL